MTTVFLDDTLRNADWIKTRSWDGIEPTDENLPMLAEISHVTVEQFKKLPSYQAWLARQSTRKA